MGMKFNDEVHFSGPESESPQRVLQLLSILPYRVLGAPKAVLVILLPMFQDLCKRYTP